MVYCLLGRGFSSVGFIGCMISMGLVWFLTVSSQLKPCKPQTIVKPLRVHTSTSPRPIRTLSALWAANLPATDVDPCLADLADEVRSGSVAAVHILICSFFHGL